MAAGGHDPLPPDRVCDVAGFHDWTFSHEGSPTPQVERVGFMSALCRRLHQGAFVGGPCRGMWIMPAVAHAIYGQGIWGLTQHHCCPLGIFLLGISEQIIGLMFPGVSTLHSNSESVDVSLLFWYADIFPILWGYPGVFEVNSISRMCC